MAATIPLPFGQSHTARIRLKGWWSPELTGPSASSGQAAKVAFETWIVGRSLYLFCPQSGADLHGRVVGHLWWNGRIITGEEVLGPLQLTKAKHQALKRACTKAESGPRMRPFKEFELDELKGMSDGIMDRGTALWFALVRELEERGVDPGTVLSGLPPTPAEPESGPPSLT